jgi:hypothetical protein
MSPSRLALAVLLVCAAVLGLAGGIVFGPLVSMASRPENKSTWDVFHGTVVDAETGRPIRGASIEATSGAPLQLFVDRDEVKSDANGEFAVRMRPNRRGSIFVRSRGYATLDLGAYETPPTRVALLRRTAEERDLTTARIDILPETHRDGFRVNLETAKVVDGDGDYDVAFRVDPADTSTVLAEAGPGRTLHFEGRRATNGLYSFPMNLATVPDTGYGSILRVPRRPKLFYCVVRRERGPRYGVTGFYPGWWFPDAGQFRYVSFETVFNRSGGRGFLGADRPIFQ